MNRYGTVSKTALLAICLAGGIGLALQPAPAAARVFFGVGVGVPWYGYGYGYPGPYYYAPPPVVYAPPVYVTPPPVEPTYAAPQAQNWYYCDNPQGYYPYVNSCTSGWRQVPAKPQ
jgi:hypothetical protein